MSSFGLSGFLEGSAPALPKNFRHIRRCALQHHRKFFGASGDAPSSLISVHL